MKRLSISLFFFFWITTACGSGEPEPTPTTLTEEPGVRVVKDNYIDSGTGYVRFLGVVENTGNVPLEFVNIYVHLLDEDGNLVGSNKSPSDIEVVYPGKTSPFSVIFSPSDSSGWQTYEIDVEFDIESQDKDYLPPDLVVVSSSGPQKGDSGVYMIEGEIKNIGSIPSTWLKVFGALYNAEGEIISVEIAWPDIKVLQPDQSFPFTLLFSDKKPGLPMTYQLWVQGENAIVGTQIAQFRTNQAHTQGAKTSTQSVILALTPTSTFAPTRTSYPTQTPTKTLMQELLSSNNPTYDLSFEVENLWRNAVVNIYQKSTNELITSIELFSFYESEDENIEYGVDMPKWSPGGHYLAFSGAIDGPSLDLYVYVVTTGAIRRLTDGPFDTGSLHWSPDGKWIVHLAQKGGCENDALWAAKADGSEVRLLYLSPENIGIAGWTGPSTFYVIEACFEPRTIRFVDIDNNTTKLIFDTEIGIVWDFAFDPDSGALVFMAIAEPPIYGFEENGFYLVSPRRTRATLMVPVDREYRAGLPTSVEWDANLGVFVTEVECEGTQGEYIAISPQGETSCVPYDPKKFEDFGQTGSP
ncbi:MAG: hypothetical protein E3J88_00360 [Anaerolineales bacterium]|nr:MAG: hypothetical protein E3J88_00360 [Anaerolineales bacterium]